MDSLSQFLNDMFEYYGKPPKSGALRIYRRALEGIQIEQLYNMFDKHIADPDSGQFIPKVADLVKVSSGTKSGNALAAWDKVYRAISEIGPYSTFTLDDPWAMRCIEEIGGFQRLCELTDDDLKFKANEFTKLYESHRAQGKPSDYPSKIKGIVELENKSEEDVLLVGDKRWAERNLENGKQRAGLNINKLKLDIKQLPAQGEH